MISDMGYVLDPLCFDVEPLRIWFSIDVLGRISAYGKRSLVPCKTLVKIIVM